MAQLQPTDSDAEFQSQIFLKLSGRLGEGRQKAGVLICLFPVDLYQKSGSYKTTGIQHHKGVKSTGPANTIESIVTMT